MEPGLARSSGIASAFPIFVRVALAFVDIPSAADDGSPRLRKIAARRLQPDSGVASGHKCNLSPKVAHAKHLLASRPSIHFSPLPLLTMCHILCHDEICPR